MYELWHMGNGIFELHCKYKDVSGQRGTFYAVAKHMIQHLGFDAGEIDIAVQEMAKEMDDTAHFGVNRGFIFTYSRVERATA